MELRKIVANTNSETNLLKYLKIYNDSPLAVNVEKGHLNIYNMLIENNFDQVIRHIVQDSDEEIAMTFAYKVYLSCLFTKRGENYNETNNYGESPLHIAAREGYLSVCHLFINNLERTTFREAKVGDTPLHCAARNGNLAICRLFINKLKDKNPGSINGYTPLHFAAMHGYAAQYSQQ